MNKELCINFWTNPENYWDTMNTKDLQSVLLHYNGEILACGSSWEIKSKRIGPGVYKVFLKKK